MRTGLRLVVPFTVLAAAACSSGGSQAPAALGTTATPSTSSATSRPASGTSAPARSGGSAVPSTAASASAVSSGAPAAGGKGATPGRGTQAPAGVHYTVAGTYTLDAKGTLTLGQPGSPQDAGGTSTLTVSAPSGGIQHTTLHSDHGDTDQDLVVRPTGTYAARLKISSPAFTKEFRPAAPVLLVGDPARVGTTWSWSGTSTDGGTTVSASNKVLRTETLTIGGTRVACVVLQSHLVLSGDVDYTADLTTWWSPAYRLAVKDHTVGKGSYNGFPFTMDITSTMRSVRPS
ncbi:MAG: hypothetical protein WCD35_18020 [Mycobacteriales bacterium]